jgi:hypothetical protein
MFDEYIAYTVEHKVAAATGVSSVAAFGDMKQVRIGRLLCVEVILIAEEIQCYFFHLYLDD